MTPDAYAAQHAASQATPCIVVAEDEVLIRMSVAAYLRDCGFYVIEASDADGVLTVLATGLRVDLVFSDVQMPGRIDGFALAHWLRRERPHIQVLLTSGRWSPPYVANDDDVDTGAFLPKPYDYRQLLREIRRLLANQMTAAACAD